MTALKPMSMVLSMKMVWALPETTGSKVAIWDSRRMRGLDDDADDSVVEVSLGLAGGGGGCEVCTAEVSLGVGGGAFIARGVGCGGACSEEAFFGTAGDATVLCGGFAFLTGTGTGARG